MSKYYLVKISDNGAKPKENHTIPYQPNQQCWVELNKPELIAIHILIQIPNKDIDIAIKSDEIVRVNIDNVCEKIRKVL